MTISLRTKVTAVTAAVVVAASLISTALTISVEKRSMERQVVSRGAALAEALARAVSEGLAAENLDLIKEVEDIVHAKDVVLIQVLSPLWLGVASVPVDQLNTPPRQEAVAFFEAAKKTEHSYFSVNTGPWIDLYAPVFLDPHDARVPNLFVGYVRLQVSTESLRKAIARAILLNVLATALLAITAVLLLNALMAKYVLRPILDLHRSASRHQKGEFPEAVPVTTNDEIGELSAQFNEMSRALKEREEKLAEEKERLAVTLRSIGDSVIVTDTQGSVTLLNKVAEQQTGWPASEAVGRQLSEVFHIVNEQSGERCGNPAEKVIGTGQPCGLANHTALIRRDGSRIVIEDSAAPIRDRNSRIVGVVLVFRDVTERRRMEEEVIKAEKLQSVGLLAGGLAHDFNNLLTAIVGNISMAKMYIDSRSKAQARLADAETASRRATDLTYQLLTFSKGGAPVRKLSNIADIIRESAGFTLSGTSVAPEYAIAPDCLPVEVDEGQMNQVFNNLIINAVHAMPNGGSIRFAVANCFLSENEVPTLPGGAYVKVSVEDSGTGITPELIPKVFDPYFTTKQKGSGLGLSSVYSIVKRHDGHITVESKPGRGTAFHIYLPASRLGPESTQSKAGTITAGRGRVLVMDDETLIRDVAGEMLRTLGYDVDFTEHGAETVALYRKALAEHKPYSVVILDLTIPAGMGGRETLQKIREFDPDVRAIVSSGYSNDPIMADYEQHGFKGVVTKPYTIGNLSSTLAAVLKK